MFGLHDFWISSAFLLSVLSAIACVVYGVINWNKGENADDLSEVVEWEKGEAEIEEKL